MRFTHLLAVALFAENLKMGNCLPGTDWSDATVLWEDQFSGGELSDVWGYELADSWQYGFSQFGNFEQQWYTEDAVRVANGKLRITAEYHKDPKVVRDLCWDECYQRCVAAGKRSGTADFDGCMDGCGNTGRRCENLGERGITSGRVQTKKGVVPPPSKEYPAIRVEVRVKMPEPGLGLWGAAWLLPPKDEPTDAPGEGLSGAWPRSGEIDVMELANQFSTLNGTIHFGSSTRDHRMRSVSKNNFTGGDGKFHTYGVEWRRLDGGSSVFTWYVDDSVYGSVPSPGKPFDGQTYSILLNLAVGGNYTEHDAGRTITVADAQATLRDRPRTMRIDYVRVLGKRD